MNKDLLNSPTDGHVVVVGNMQYANRSMPNNNRGNGSMSTGPVMQSLCGPDGVNSVVVNERRPEKCGCKKNDKNRDTRPVETWQTQRMPKVYANPTPQQPVRPPVKYANANQNYPGIAQPQIKNT